MDENKTALTHRVTAIAAAYLDGLGCKPVETEVPVAPGWVADVASYWYPTETEGKRLKLNDLAVETMDSKRPDNWLPIAHSGKLFGRVFGPGPFTVLVEVKTSKGDSPDRKWTLPPPAHLCFVAYPTGVIERADLPTGWFGMETSADGKRMVAQVRGSGRVHPQFPGPMLEFIANVGIRRDHRTREVALRAWTNASNAQDRETQKQYRAARLLDNLAAWLHGTGFQADRSFEQLLKDVGIKKLPKYATDGATYFQELKRTLDSND